ncbi:MAG TPA: DUF5947 family protein [Solirubrobacteraceae bacterium]|jgi:Fe-S cluster biogenesis protein NfuA|nr:DUF5947 family protein [Solirubrobacteraceae bacterium]
MHATATAAGEREAPEQLLARVQELQGRLEESEDSATRRLAEELVAAVTQMYGGGLRAVVESLFAAGDAGARIATSLAEDPLVATLLLIHDLHPVSLEQRVRAALEQVRPYMESHGGNVELLSLERGVARIRLQGSCSHCSASTVTLEQAIKGALEERAPDLEGLEVEGVTPQAAAGAGLPIPAGGCAPVGVELPLMGSQPPARPVGNGLPLMGSQPPARPAGRAMPILDSRSPATRTGGAHEGLCDICGVDIPADHRHLLQLAERRIVCACESCWGMRSGEGDYRPTGARTLWLADLDLPDDLWASFQIPIGLAFFMSSTVTGCVVAMYPSPGGATESELHFESWQRMCELNPPLAGLEGDIEGLVVNRLADPPLYAIAPIDRCYELTGMVKANWEGLSGGSRVQGAIAEFFERLRGEAVPA